WKKRRAASPPFFSIARLRRAPRSLLLRVQILRPLLVAEHGFDVLLRLELVELPGGTHPVETIFADSIRKDEAAGLHLFPVMLDRLFLVELRDRSFLDLGLHQLDERERVFRGPRQNRHEAEKGEIDD